MNIESKPGPHDIGYPLLGVKTDEDYGAAKINGEGVFLHRFDDESLAAMRELTAALKAKQPTGRRRCRANGTECWFLGWGQSFSPDGQLTCAILEDDYGRVSNWMRPDMVVFLVTNASDP